ncbi:MAG: acyl-CoA desaturase [Chloroflexi bacterium]|nr:acyl-CoA desaturase [Chloroflexota bacterium]MCL5274080.1 acyl-CoA desaturase [Chloroflexota bacterium]
MSILKHNPVKSLAFTQQFGFRKTLIERVDRYLREHNLPARDVPAMYLKAAVVLAWWLISYLLILLGGLPPLIDAALCIVWALSIASIGFNVMHDANHGSFSRHALVNKLLSFSAEFIGISGFRWRTKHNVWHHTYTNIAGLDDDVEAYGFMRLSPHEKWKPLHKLQAWYFPIVYSMIGFDFMIRDFAMIFAGKSDANHVYPRMNRSDKVVFWLGKAFYFAIMIGLPLLFHPWWQVLIGFFLVLLTVGLTMGIVFQLAHVLEIAAYPEPAGNPPHMDNEWAIHQVETTADFAPHNILLNLYAGGLNYQIEHHLLPHICHLNYPRLAPIVRQTCEEFGIKYNCFTSWRAAFASHWHELRILGQAPRVATARP